MLLTDNLCGGGGGWSLKQYPNRPEKNVRKHEKLIWKLKWKSCSTTHLHFLQTNSIITGGLFTKNIPTKMKRKKKGGGVQQSQKVKGSLLNPKTTNFSSCPCMIFRSYFLKQQTEQSLIG